MSQKLSAYTRVYTVDCELEKMQQNVFVMANSHKKNFVDTVLNISATDISVLCFT